VISVYYSNILPDQKYYVTVVYIYIYIYISLSHLPLPPLSPTRRHTHGYRFVITFGHRCPPLRYTTAMLLNRLRLLDTCCVSIACELQDTDYRSRSTSPHSETELRISPVQSPASFVLAQGDAACGSPTPPPSSRVYLRLSFYIHIISLFSVCAVDID